MKKFCTICFLFFVFVFCGFNNVFFDFLVGLDCSAKVSFYCAQKNKGFFEEEIKNGQGYVYTISGKDAQNVYENLMGCYGFSVKLDAKWFEEILKNVRVVKKEVVCGVQNYYGVAGGLIFFNFLDNKKINVQIAKTVDNVIVGSPIILGSY